MTSAPFAAAGTGGLPDPNGGVESALAFRQKLGLRSDRAYVAATFTQRGFSSAAWGVPLDQAEAGEVGRRAKLQEELGPALRRWDEAAGNGGAYIDHQAKGAPVFLTTRDPAKAKGAVAGVIPAGANARFVRVAHSMADLLAVQERVNADLDAGLLAGLGVTSTAIDARENAVTVGVVQETAAARAALAALYGDAVRPVFELPAQGGDACTTRADCLPAKAGIEIRSSFNNNNCTIGFLARVVGSAAPRILTAGHCIALSGGTGTSRTWSHDGQSMGWAELGYWTNGGDADVGVLAPPTAAIGGDRNRLYRSSASDIVPITGWRPTAQQIQGQLVCRAGAVSGYHCGTIVLTNRTLAVDGRTIDHQWVVDFDACPGDSGGPYFAGSTALGIHTDSTVGCSPASNQAWYSPIGWALDVLASRGHPLELCVTASCGQDTNVWVQRESLASTGWSPHLVDVAGGRVLAVGDKSRDPLVGSGGSGALAPELFNPAAGTWAHAAAPPWASARCDGQFAVRLAGGDVLVGGGRNVGSGGADACNGAHLFDPDDGSAGSWSSAQAPPVALASAGAVLLSDGRVFVSGGSVPDGATPVAMAYDPGTDAWTALAPPPAGALGPLVLALPDGRVLVAGGYVVADAGGPGYASVAASHIYNPSTNTWASTTAVGASGLAGAVLKNGRAVVAGGQTLSWDGSQRVAFHSTVRSFNPATNTWSTLAPLGRARVSPALVELGNGLLLAAGGRVEAQPGVGAATGTAEAYNPATNTWHAAPGLVSAHGEPAGTLLANGSALVAGGGTATTETYIPGDILPPTTSASGIRLRTGASMTTSSIPIEVSWTGADTGGAGVATYDVGRSVDGGAYTTIATSVAGTTLDTTGSNGHTYRFRVRARDWAGNVGAWVTGTSRRLATLEQNSTRIAYGGTWSTNLSSSYSGGSVRYASTAGRSASYTFHGRGIAWVSARGPSRGSARVYIDGIQVATVSLYSSTTTYRYVAFRWSWSSPGTHTIKIVVAGTSGHPRVDVDVFEVIGDP